MSRQIFEISYLTAWLGRDLAALLFVYLFLNATFLPSTRGAARRKGPLRLRGPLESRRKALLHLAVWDRESYDFWRRAQALLRRGGL